MAPMMGVGFPSSPAGLRQILGVPAAGGAGKLPFSAEDVTAGTETELQTAVRGGRAEVDLPLTIEASNFYHNVRMRWASGEMPARSLSDLESFLQDNAGGWWENSWVRFPRARLGDLARATLEADLAADKSDPASPPRQDAGRFACRQGGEELLRVPMSYLLKLALAEALEADPLLPRSTFDSGRRLMSHFVSDNTSPETTSFHIVRLERATGMGRAIARETSLRFLFTHLLTRFAALRFELAARGQQPQIYFSPCPPVRQKRLNDLISDAYYRELFMSPCLNGWDRGEDKHRYMHLCHQVLSRSQLNTLAKLREAGIITRNLVRPPNPSNVSLANNGIHLSIGSRKLTALAASGQDGFAPEQAKWLADLVIKIAEHFLPLFIGTYSAAPGRLGFEDLAPERALGFLPHQLDPVHLRMLWRRWKGKARLRILGRPVTPFGPTWIDRPLSRLFGLRGDLVPDLRLIDYLVCLPSTDRSPALDGTLGNQKRLACDLAELGVFDARMSVYLPYRERTLAAHGFCGFEGRYYSLFPSLTRDLAPAADLQVLVTALACRYVLQQRLLPAQIPDRPHVESERRQIIFAAAIGLPTFYVESGSRNRLLARLVARTAQVRRSRRYPGTLRVPLADYRRALLEVLREDGPDLIEELGMESGLRDLRDRLDGAGGSSAAEVLVEGICGRPGRRRALALAADDYNLAAERYYRGPLLAEHLDEGLGLLRQDAIRLERSPPGSPAAAVAAGLGSGGPVDLVDALRRPVLDDQLAEEDLRRLLHLLLAVFEADGASGEVKPCCNTSTSSAPPAALSTSGCSGTGW